jgi:succinate dehydrogenase/fumarate reductase cytochrome b subunit
MPSNHIAANRPDPSATPARADRAPPRVAPRKPHGFHMKLRALHRYSSILIGAFAFAHITNHLVALNGVSSHIAFMELARHVYRQPIVESVLLLCVAFQAASGLWFVIHGWRQRRGLVPWLQALSGAYLALFLAVHVGAVLYGRVVLHLDTNFYYAAAGLHVPPNGFFFAPYYFIAVLALFTHIACAVYWRLGATARQTPTVMIGLPMLIGACTALLIVMSLAGKLQPVDVPAKYKATYAHHDG